MDHEIRSPKITRIAWGETEVEGLGTFKDVKLFPGGARPWDWSETGTEHSPGIQIADVEELLEKGAVEVVLTQGVLGMLKVMSETITALETKGIIVHIYKTNQAAEVYNQLAEDRLVGGLFHSTC